MTVDRQGDLPAITEAAARHGIPALAIWRHQVAALGLERAARLIRDAGFVLSGYCRGGMMVADRAQRPAAREDNSRALEEAAVLGAPCLVIVPGGLPQFSRPGSEASKDIAAARAMVVEELGELLHRAREMGMPLALEPLHPMLAADRGCISTLRQALDICDALDPDRSGALGVVVDVYHCWWDPELESQIHRAGARRLLSFQVCDWLVPTNHLLNDRGMMGDGIIEIPLIRRWMEAAGFAGYAEVELFSERWWAQPIDEVLGLCLERHRCRV
jgi:sugar phosphate isomerase/epimerase